MKTKRFLFLLCTLILVMSTTSVIAAPSSPDGSTVNAPWKVQLLKGSEAGFTNLSTTFVGANEIPFVSYSKVGSQSVSMAFPATTAFPGNCGSNNGWHCAYYLDYNLDPGTLSNVATDRYGPDTFGVKWVYKDGAYIRGFTREYTNDMNSILTQHAEDLIQLSKFGGVLVGTPSIYMDGLWLRMAVVIRGTGDFPTYKLVYMHYTGNTPKTSCIDSGSVYQCDVIDEAIGYNTIGSPSLDLAPDYTVGIAYYYNGAVKYAYPHNHTLTWPSNCGPMDGGNNTWRCITIYAGTETGEVDDVVRFSFGPTVSDRGIVFRYDDVLIDDTIYHAEYVGSGGNCGVDKIATGMNIAKWRCRDIVSLGNLAASYQPSYSTTFDPQGYPVISYDHAPGDLSPVMHYIAYPNSRAGISGDGWIEQKIDGAPVTQVSTGALTNVSFDSAGYGFVAYLQEEDYALPDLKIALQARQVFLPITIK